MLEYVLFQERGRIMRRLKGTLASSSILLSTACAAATRATGGGDVQVSEDEAMQKLKEGNKRFVAST